jgi:hypothetical protein
MIADSKEGRDAIGVPPLPGLCNDLRSDAGWISQRDRER